MSEIPIRTRVQNKDVVDDIEDAIASGINIGGRKIGADGSNLAEARVREVGAVWTGNLANSFEISTHRAKGQMVVVIENTSDHAAPLEYGAEYTDKGPPVEALIPWVHTKMRGFTIPEDDPLPDIDRDQQIEVETMHGAEDLSEVFSQETLEKAFWLQKRIKAEGIDAIRYMEMAEEWIEETGAETVADYIELQMRDV